MWQFLANCKCHNFPYLTVRAVDVQIDMIMGEMLQRYLEKEASYLQIDEKGERKLGYGRIQK